MHRLPIEPAVIEISHCPLCVLLTPKLGESWQGQPSKMFRELVSSSWDLDWIYEWPTSCEASAMSQPLGTKRESTGTLT